MSEPFNTLVESAKFFASEAASNAVAARAGDEKKWNLAALHLVTGFEHAAKALLAKQHPVFIRTRIDVSKTHTVTLEGALKRLQDKSIYGLHVSNEDVQRIARAVKLRNTIAHGGRSDHPQALEASFFEVIAYLRDFFWIHLSIRLFDTFPALLAEEIAKAETQAAAILQRADANVKRYVNIWTCSECFSKHMVQIEKKFQCFYCLHEEPIFRCDGCSAPLPEHEALDSEELFEWDFSNDPTSLAQNYGIDERKVCENCFDELRVSVAEKIKEQMKEDAMDYWP